MVSLWEIISDEELPEIPPEQLENKAVLKNDTSGRCTRLENHTESSKR